MCFGWLRDAGRHSRLRNEGNTSGNKTNPKHQLIKADQADIRRDVI